MDRDERENSPVAFCLESVAAASKILEVSGMIVWHLRLRFATARPGRKSVRPQTAGNVTHVQLMKNMKNVPVTASSGGKMTGAILP